MGAASRFYATPDIRPFEAERLSHCKKTVFCAGHTMPLEVHIHTAIAPDYEGVSPPGTLI